MSIAESPDLHFSDEFGPAMLALNERQRAFVISMFEAPFGKGALKRAALRAGYASGSTPAVQREIAHQLWNNPKIQRAYRELGERYIGSLVPVALKAIHSLLLDAGHKDHMKACRAILDRNFPIESVQKIDVTHQEIMSEREFLELAPRLAEQLGIPVGRLVGNSRPIPLELEALYLEHQSDAENDGEGDNDGE